MANRKPDYRVAAMNKVTDDKANVGAAWLNTDGTISIILEPFVVLSQSNRALLITLFPTKE